MEEANEEPEHKGWCDTELSQTSKPETHLDRRVLGTTKIGPVVGRTCLNNHQEAREASDGANLTKSEIHL